MSQLKKLAQGYQSQDGSAQLGDIDEDDEVPGIYLFCGIIILRLIEYFCEFRFSRQF